MGSINLIEMVTSGHEEQIRQAIMNRSSEISQKEFQEAFFRSFLHANLNISELLLPYIDINAKVETSGFSALHLASQNQNPDAAQFLIEHGADVNVQDNQGQTPLHIAIDSELMTALDLTDTLGSYIPACAVVSALLIQRGADVNTISYDGSTPLDWASQHKTAETLLQGKGAVHGKTNNS